MILKIILLLIGKTKEQAKLDFSFHYFCTRSKIKSYFRTAT